MTDENTEKRPSFKRAKPEPKEEVVAPAVVVEAPPSLNAGSVPNRLQEVASLIEVKHYVHGLIGGNFTTDKAKMKELQGIDLLLDKKLVDLILSPEFKAFVNFDEVDKVVKAAAWNNNVKSSLYR